MLKVEGLSKRFGDAVALDRVDLHVAEGEKVAIMGPSGCGKSTLLRCIVRLIEPDAGRIIVDGEPVLELEGPRLEALRRRIGFVFQHGNLIRRLSVLDNVMMPLRMAGIEEGERWLRVRNALDRVGLWHLRFRKPAELSGGERQRAAIARALALQPRLMLWDEPTSALDPVLVLEVLDVMEDLVRQSGTTMVIVTHEAGFAYRFAHRVVLMEKGRIVESGPPRQVFGQPCSEVGRRYRRLVPGLAVARDAS